MKFDIARKIVKFQDGQYGIRRWTWIGYEFLGLRMSSSDRSSDRWWFSPDYVALYAMGTEEQARARLALYLQPKPPKPATPGYDKGRPA